MTSGDAAGRLTVVSAERAMAGLVTPRTSSSFRESGSRRVMESTYLFITLAARRRLPSFWMGPMPQPYMMTGQWCFFAAARVQR